MLCLLGSKVEERGAEVGGWGRAGGVWDAGVNRGEKVIEIRQREETEWVGFICVRGNQK